MPWLPTHRMWSKSDCASRSFRIRHALLHEVGADDAHAAVYVETHPPGDTTAVGSDMSNAATFPMANP